VLAAAALLLSTTPAWAAVAPTPQPGVSQPPNPGAAGSGVPTGPPGASATPGVPGPAAPGFGPTHSPAATGPGAAKPWPTVSPVRPPTARPSPTSVPSTRPSHLPAAPGHDQGPVAGPLRPPQPEHTHQPHGPAHVGERPVGGGRMGGTYPSGGPYDPAPDEGQGGETPTLVPADEGASPTPVPPLGADAQREEDGQAASSADRRGPVMRMVPLGAGLLLVGLGLGFLGLRLRRP
jgi:hypothetical protein